MFRPVFTGTPDPRGLLTAVLRRIRADRHVGYLRCCVIKGYLSRTLRTNLPMSMESDSPDPALQFGRLFSTLEKTQRRHRENAALAAEEPSALGRHFSLSSAMLVSGRLRPLRWLRSNSFNVAGARQWQAFKRYGRCVLRFAVPVSRCLGVWWVDRIGQRVVNPPTDVGGSL